MFIKERTMVDDDGLAKTGWLKKIAITIKGNQNTYDIIIIGTRIMRRRTFPLVKRRGSGLLDHHFSDQKKTDGRSHRSIS